MTDWLISFYSDPTALHLLVAFVLGAVVGAERQWRKDVGGLRVNVLVSLGAAGFIDLMGVFGQPGMPQAIGNIVSGVGFLGAGLIIKEGANVRGLSTAATVWCVAAMGAMAGASEYTAAGLMCLFISGVNLILRPLIEILSHRAAPKSSEPAIFVVHAEAAAAEIPRLRRGLSRLVAAFGLSLRAVSTKVTDGGAMLLSAELRSDDGVSETVERLVDALGAEAPLTAVRWEVGGTSGSGF